jgi:hypothetical protein
MKTSLMIITCVVLTITSLQAQSVARETVQVTEDQVPMVVRQAFEKDFGTIPVGGIWSAYIVKELEGSRVVAKPLWYSYSHGKKANKIEVRFTPQGEVASTKGVPDQHAASDTSVEAKKKSTN